jgi:hypothetical protein
MGKEHSRHRIRYLEKYARMIRIDEELCSDVHKKLLGTKKKECYA